MDSLIWCHQTAFSFLQAAFCCPCVLSHCSRSHGCFILQRRDDRQVRSSSCYMMMWIKHTSEKASCLVNSHWLVNSFVLFGAPYMLFDIYAMYLNHRHTLEGSQTPSRRSLHAVRAFLLRDWMLVLHHLVLVFIFLPITLVRSQRNPLSPNCV